MKVHPHDPWVRLAQANIILGRNEEACRLLITAADYEPLLWEIWRDLTVVSARCEHFAKAASSYHNAVKINPLYENEEILKRIVSSLVNGKLDESYRKQVRTAACQLLNELTRIFPRNPNFWCLLGVVLASESNAAPHVRALALKKLNTAIEIIQSPYNKWYVHDAQTTTALRSSQMIVDCLVNVGYLLQGTQEGSDSLKIALNYSDYVTTKLENLHSDFLTKSVRQLFLDHYNLLKQKYQKIKQCSI